MVIIKKVKEAIIDIPSLETGFEKALKTENNPDLDAIDQIISNPAWQSNRLGRRISRQLELMALDHMISQAAEMLNNQENTDIEGISGIVNRPSWQQIYSYEKKQFEHNLLTFLEEVVSELTEKGRASSAFRRIEFFYKTMEDRSIISKLNNKINDCRQRKQKFETHIADSIEKISQFTQSGNFAQAQAISAQLLEEAPDNEEVKKAQILIQHEKQIFEQTIKEIQQIIDSGALDTASEKLNKLKTRYPDIIQIASIHENLQKRISEDFIKQTLDLEKQGNPEKACLWLENRIKKYPDFISLHSIARESSEACALFNRCLDFMETQAIESLEKMDFNTFSTIAQKAETYQHQVPVKANNTLKHIKYLTDDYTNAEKDNDLKKKRELISHLEHQAKLARIPLSESCDLLKIQQQLSEQAETWETILAQIPATQTEIRHNLEKLCEIQVADNGEYGNRAASRINDLNQELKRHKISQLKKKQFEAETKADWPKAIEYLIQLQELDPTAEYPSKRTADLRQKINEENLILQNALDRKEENFLKTARQLIEPLAQFSSVKDKAEALSQELDKDMENIREQAATLWKETRIQLYLLKKHELDKLTRSAKELLNCFKDSDEISAQVERLDRENAVRGRLARITELETKLKEAGDQATLADYGLLAEKVKDILKENPEYPPLQNILNYWHDRIMETLLTNYKTHADQKKFHAAKAVLQDWHRYYKTADMEQEVRKAFGDEFGFFMLDEFIDQAARESFIAENYYTRLDFKEAGKFTANALNICTDDPKALDLARKLDDWDKGINTLRKVEHILEKYDHDSSTDLTEAQKLLDEVKKLPVIFRDLNTYDLKWNTPAVYASEIENRTGIIGRIRLSIVPGKNYLIFVSDKITFGSPKDPGADLKIRAGGIKPGHGQIIRKKQEFYLSKHAGECMVCGEAAETRKLNLGDEIRLGKTFLFKVTALSKGCLVMIMDNSNPLDYSLEGIVMIDNTLDIGPEKNVHIRIPRLRSSCQLLYHNQGFSLADESGETRLTLGQVQRVGDVQFLLTRES
ncbi:MAG: hypothetical protein GY795_37095 [Desulfobacterales bacterium]|nr:hypothetical protein [Desulfobacterales bacterium]